MSPKGVFFLLMLFLCGFDLSAQRRAKLPYIKVADIPYASYPGSNSILNSLDIYMPIKGSNSPTVIWIHGGSWAVGDKSEVDQKAEYFTSKGFAFVSVNYRLSPKVKHPVHAQDVANAITWFYQNAKHYSADARKIFLMGHSAGAHLAALVTIDERYLKTSGVASSIRGIVLLDGIGFDISNSMRNANNKLRSWYAQAFGNTAWDWSQGSPSNFVNANDDIPPVLLLCSDDDAEITTEANRFYKKIKDTGASARIIQYPRGSSSMNKKLGEEDDQTTTDVMRFVTEVLSGQAI
jgi:acetyl esterase/lipase